jgi:hypothetical protein
MILSYHGADGGNDFSAFEVSRMESELQEYFESQRTSSILADVNPLTFYVAVQTTALQEAGEVLVTASVSLLYESERDQAVALERVLNEEKQERVAPSFSFAGDKLVTMDFRAVENDTRVLDVLSMDDGSSSGRSGSEKGLIVATTILSIMLIVVSSVLLYVTGGWSACRSRINNCLFEEIEEEDDDDDDHDDYKVGQQRTDEEMSVTTESAAPTSASGILGAAYPSNPTAGLGIQADYETDGGTTVMMEGETPTSNAMGIASMQKMVSHESSEDDEGGLTGMIMQRFAHNRNNP